MEDAQVRGMKGGELLAIFIKLVNVLITPVSIRAKPEQMEVTECPNEQQALG